MSKSPKKSKSLTRAGNRPATISAQQTIPYVRMLPDGICQLPGGFYTKTLEYEDINYSVASAEDQTAIFSGWSSWLNYFDSSLPFQLSFVNRRSRSGSRYKVNIPEADDRFNSVRTEYTGMLKNQIAKSNNGIERAKYVTFGIPAENVAAARPRLERVEADVIGNFKRLGVQSQPLDGRERLALLHDQLHPGSREPFRFKWADIAHTGMGTKDFIVPDSFDFRQSRSFCVGYTGHPAKSQDFVGRGGTAKRASPVGYGGARGVELATTRARRPTCRSWRRSCRTSCCWRFWSWMPS